MARNKRNICKNIENNEKTNKRSKIQNKNNDNINSETTVTTRGVTNDLRRSNRISDAKTLNVSKSKYFKNDSEDDSDVSIGSDRDYKPNKSKTKSKQKQNIVKQNKRKIESNSGSEEEEEEEEEWEEVKDNPLSELDDYNPDIPEEGVEITINKSEDKKKKGKCFDLNDYIRQKINRFKKELQINKHKMSLILFISRIFYLNNTLNDEFLKAISLSITTNEFKSQKKLTIGFLNDFIDWFRKNFHLNKELKSSENESICDSISRCLQQRVAKNSCELNMTFISLLRSVNKKYNVRLCYALNPIDIKANDLILSETQLKTKNKSSNCNKDSVLIKKISNKGNKSDSKVKKRKTVSSNSDVSKSIDTNEVTEECVEYWVEVYVESERQWVCLELSNNIINKPLDIANKSLPQLSYIIGLDSEEYLREITQRYVNDWMSVAMKRRRIDDNWWTQTLVPFQRKTKSAAEKVEDLEFENKKVSTPLPNKISEYKNHPLYVLTKDLLKFQGIYPSDAPPLGFFKGEPVYARECVQLLRSRETWLRFARTVKVGESAYKLVKSRPKWDKYAKIWRRDLPLELFGKWQTLPYEPPEAKNGVVPRNGYGNVDLYQPSMLPKGCVHLQLPGLLRIANKLKIDCSPAIVAFDNNNGGMGCHPVMDGFVVCEEFKEVLIDAWNEEQEIARKRELEKKEKRIYGNWKKLIKGLLIRDRVNFKYRNSEESPNTDTEASD